MYVYVYPAGAFSVVDNDYLIIIIADQVQQTTTRPREIEQGVCGIESELDKKTVGCTEMDDVACKKQRTIPVEK